MVHLIYVTIPSFLFFLLLPFFFFVAKETSCGVVTLHDESGVITSPWYPEMYPNEADCFWIIQTEGRFNIRLTFDQFDLEAGHDKLYVGGVEPDTDGISDFLVRVHSRILCDILETGMTFFAEYL